MGPQPFSPSGRAMSIRGSIAAAKQAEHLERLLGAIVRNLRASRRGDLIDVEGSETTMK
jgi:hypothetical protein